MEQNLKFMICLDDILKNLLLKLGFKFWFKDKLCIDFLDYFPILKSGKCVQLTIFKYI